MYNISHTFWQINNNFKIIVQELIAIVIDLVVQYTLKINRNMKKKKKTKVSENDHFLNVNVN